uniref:Uncharacterized protein n=1 Tax=Salix viminalis TaxID=40686 RepID=A0A6N2L5W4_SALVM
MPEVIQGQDPEENDKPAKNVVPEEPRNEGHLDLDDCSNRCIYREAPETETEKLDLDNWSNRPEVFIMERHLDPKLMISRPYIRFMEQLLSPEVRSLLSLPPNQDSAKIPNQRAEDGKSAKDINKVTNVIVLGSE